MKWIVRLINKMPKLKTCLSLILNLFKTSFMYLANKVLGVNEKKVVFISFGGKSYSDNPKAISEKLYNLYPEFEIVWLFNDVEEKSKLVPDYVRCVKEKSLKSLIELATAKFWVDNFPKYSFIYKSDNQYYIQTWHGDRGFKKILYDAWPDKKRPEPVIEEQLCDLCVTGSKYGEMQFRSAFNYKGELLRGGSPRNDKLLKNDKVLIKNIKRSLKVKDNINILLYAPTYRDSLKNIKQQIDIDIKSTLTCLKRCTGEDWCCLIRSHVESEGFSTNNVLNNIIDVTLYEDMADLLLVSDMLITDYSSSAGDFPLLNKPVILFLPNDKDYIENDRELYFEINSSPFWVATSQQELENLIVNINEEGIANNCKDILEFYGAYETGNSSEITASKIIEVIRNYKS